MRRHKFKAIADDDTLPVMVPRNDKASVPIPRERVRTLCKHLIINRALRAEALSRDGPAFASDQRSFFNFQRSFDRIDEKGELAHAVRVFVGGALDLAGCQFHADAGQNFPGLLQVEIADFRHNHLLTPPVGRLDRRASQAPFVGRAFIGSGAVQLAELAPPAILGLTSSPRPSVGFRKRVAPWE
jgi:hypothetical protein